MSNDVFVIADLHFGHAKVAALRGFADVELHNAAIIAAWNRVVSKRDVVYVLGDVFRLEPVIELNGTKKLALGNHDQRPFAVYGAVFSKVRACFEFDDALLTHIPVHPSQFARWRVNVHGHTHENRIADVRYRSVSVEQCPRMEPRLLREVIAG